MTGRKFINKNNLYILILFVFSIFVNSYYANLGALPVDTFLHFDLGFKILEGLIPFSDVWMVSGIIVNYIQALFFYILGISWTSYVLHGSIINCVVTLSTYFLLKNFKIHTNYCFIYSIFFAILAYPSSGTPFVDHHSTFFSLLGIYSLLAAIKSDKKIFWILIPIFFGMGFLSKQVPTSYIALSVFIILIFYAFLQKKMEFIKFILFGLIVFLFFIFIGGFLAGIKFENFFNQYILYPTTIGQSRVDSINLEFTFQKFIFHFKFIHFVILALLVINLKRIIRYKNTIKKKNFFYFLVMVFFTYSLIFHQLLTKNQTYIFFIIPILIAFLHKDLVEESFKNKNLALYGLIIFCLFITTKYHLRFNEGRKFHDLSSTDLSKSIPAEKIDKKLSGLNWISPEYKNSVEEEINLVVNIKNHLSTDKRKKMVITHYSFLSTILNENFFSPSMAFPNDGSAYPKKNNKFAENYKDLIINGIKKNNIEIIYIIHPIKKESLYDYLDETCFEEKIIFAKLNSYKLLKCSDLNK